ncbi:MAG TPA: SurA N-terminal domain-containing protein [Xanthobacteraceae bacterium]|nr:SurA N-terminal domain-containing protein [Xanthobacteraceae bacterium]
MLRGIRKASSNWLGRAVMGVVMFFLAASFAVWGINDIFRGFGRSYLAKVGNTEISADQFRQAYNDRLRQLSQEIGRPIPPEQANALGLDRQVLGQLIAGDAVDQIARKMRLGIPDAEIVRHVMSDPHFRTPTGQFDNTLFQYFLRTIGFSEQRYFDEQRRAIPRREITDAISGGVQVPKVYLDAVDQFQNQQRSIDYLTLGPAQAGDIPEPTADELSKYFDARKIMFRAPEYRKIATLSVIPAELAKSIEVSDADVKKAYDENIKAYVTPERRHVEQIVFPNMAEAQAASDRIKSGTTFAALAAERGLKEPDFDLGTVAKSAVVDPAVADAAFSLKEGEVSAPVNGRFGAVLVTVLKIEPEVTKPLNVVAPFIHSDIALERAKKKVQDIHDQIEDARAGGATLEEAAKKLNLTIVTLDVDRSGRDQAGKPAATIPAAGNVLNAAFSSDIGVDAYPVEAEGGYVWYEVEGVTPSRDRKLDEVKTDVEQRWRDDEVAKRLKDKAADLLGKAKTGSALDVLAATAGVKVEKTADLKRGTTSPGVPPRAIDAVFHTAKDAFGSSEGSKPTEWIVFRVTDVKTPAFDPKSTEGKKIDQLLQRSVAEDLFTQYLAWAQAYLGTTVNQAVLAQALGSVTPDNE